MTHKWKKWKQVKQKMNSRIRIEPIQKEFVVRTKDANKQKRNRSFSNASPCHHAKLKQEKRCSVCNEHISTTACQHKIVKIGKDEHIIPAEALKSVQDVLAQQETITITKVLDKVPVEAEEWYEGLVWVTPEEKKEQQYAELSQLFADKVGVGTAVFRNNEYQVILKMTNGVLSLRKLVEQSQKYDIDKDNAQRIAKQQVNQDILDLEKQILNKKTESDIDLSEFRDTRAEYEEKIIEEYVLNGEIPQTITTTTQDTKEQDELQRLKALAGE